MRVDDSSIPDFTCGAPIPPPVPSTEWERGYREGENSDSGIRKYDAVQRHRLRLARPEFWAGYLEGFSDFSWALGHSLRPISRTVPGKLPAVHSAPNRGASSLRPIADHLKAELTSAWWNNPEGS